MRSRNVFLLLALFAISPVLLTLVGTVLGVIFAVPAGAEAGGPVTGSVPGLLVAVLSSATGLVLYTAPLGILAMLAYGGMLASRMISARAAPKEDEKG